MEAVIEMNELDEGNISSVAFFDHIHLNYLYDDIFCSWKTRKKKAELSCAQGGILVGKVARMP